MSFISYAQNFEDVMLWRALKHIKKGFYIDVGAAWPDQDSVTKAFYDRGWQGINIEPNPKWFELLQNSRPRDINLQIAVQERLGKVNVNLIHGTGLSSLDEQIATNHAKAGWTVDTIEVDAVALQQVIERYAPMQDIHFLKIDVEGFEAQVIRSNDWLKFRPWVLVIEATLPLSQIESHEWEEILTSAGYLFTYADGLNRFYVASERNELCEAFRYPPNVFDEFLQASHVAERDRADRAEAAVRSAEDDVRTANERLTTLEHRIASMEQEANDLRHEVDEQGCRLRQVRNELHEVYASSSWRLTRPLRYIGRHIGLARGR